MSTLLEKTTLRDLLINALLETNAAPDTEEAENIADDLLNTPSGHQLGAVYERGVNR